MTGGSTHDPWSGQPDDEYPDFLWPGDDDDQDAAWPDEVGQLGGDGRGVPPGYPVPFRWPVPFVADPVQTACQRRRSLIALTVTAVVAVGLGAGAVLVRVGNVVEAQIAVTNGTAKLVSLQDSASES